MFPANNPFTRESWRAGNGQSDNGVFGGHSPPSVFGALPYSSTPALQGMLQDLVTFRFTSFNPTILNCQVMGPQNEVYYRVATNASTQGHTIVKDNLGSNVALITWSAHPQVEILGQLSRDAVGNWLRLSDDRSRRLMNFHGVHYSLAPNDRFICLDAPGFPASLARISKSYDTVLLEMTPAAMQLGLLEAAIITTVLLQSGRSID